MCYTKHLSLINKVLLSLWLLSRPFCAKAQEIDLPQLICYSHVGTSAISPEVGKNNATTDTTFVEVIAYNRDTLLTGISQKAKRPVRPFALKTNLLFDAASILNVEVEVPLAKQWSIAGEWVFPWWLWEEKQHCLELLQGSLEVRYWLTNNYSRQHSDLDTHNPLAGWFVGLYGGAGYYDLEWNRKGYQGEFFIATGISAGYVQPLNRNLSLEFSLGLGYLKTDYRYYEARKDAQDEWHLIKQYPGTYTWIGPTKAKVSLIWYPHFYKKVKIKKQ